MGANIFILLILFIYMPFHFLEEALGDFPKWMYKHWTPIHLSYGHWMANNLFIFYPILVVSYLLYHFNPEAFSTVGGGILIWGIINWGEHVFYTIKDGRVSPGLITSMIYLVDALMGIKVLFTNQNYTIVMLILSIIIGEVLFGMPCYLSKQLAKHFEIKFGKSTSE